MKSRPIHTLSRFLGRHWFSGLLLASLLGHVVVLIVIQPWASTEMSFDRQAEIERTALVQQRELERKELERKRRQELKLPREEAEKLKRAEELKRLPTLRENVRELVEARDKVMEEREEAFKRLKERTEGEDLLPDQFERLREELTKAVHGAHQATHARVQVRGRGRTDEGGPRERRLKDGQGVEASGSARRLRIRRTYRKKAAEIAEMLGAAGGSGTRRCKTSRLELDGIAGERRARRNTQGRGTRRRKRLADGLDIDTDQRPRPRRTRSARRPRRRRRPRRWPRPSPRSCTRRRWSWSGRWTRRTGRRRRPSGRCCKGSTLDEAMKATER